MILKKNFTAFTAMLVLSCFIIISCAGDSDKAPETRAAADRAETAKPSAEITEDTYVEITAKQMYWSAKMMELHEDASQAEAMRAVAEFNEKMNTLFEDHGVTEDAYNEYSDKLKENFESYSSVFSRVTARVEELAEEK
ncbi:MAG TPA: hypothetical protein ENN03_03215 [bacterium]|nr:hypothetical protein [bacterium]